MMFTEQNCKDVGITLGMPEDKSTYFFHYYNAQGWVFNSGQPIKNLNSAMWRWQRNGYQRLEQKKQKLFPIKGKFCAEMKNGRRCGMPAVYKGGGDYDNYYCEECMPAKVKAKYE